MYAAVMIVLMLAALAVPYIGLCAGLHRRIWPSVVGICAFCVFLLLQVWLLGRTSAVSHPNGLGNIASAVRLTALLLAVGALVLNGAYLMLAFPRTKQPRLQIGKWGQFLVLTVLQILLMGSALLYVVYGRGVEQYTGASLAQRIVPIAWLATLAAEMGLWLLRKEEKKFQYDTLPAALVFLLVFLLYPAMPDDHVFARLYEPDGYFRVLMISYIAPMGVVLSALNLLMQGRGRVWMGILLGILVLVLVIKTPYLYHVNSEKQVYGYVLGEETPHSQRTVMFRGIFVQQLRGNDYFSGVWSMEDYTDGEEPITTFSPDDRPYKNITRYDETDEKQNADNLQLFGNNRFTRYVITVSSRVEGTGDDPTQEIFCTDAPHYTDLVETAKKCNLGDLDNYYGAQVEVTP